MDLRGKIVSLSRHFDLTPKEYICTADFGDRLELVLTAPGQEDVVLPLIQFRGSGLVATLHSWRDDPKQIEIAKLRFCSRIGLLLDAERDEKAIDKYERIQENMARLQSLDGDEPAKCNQPTPVKDNEAKKVYDLSIDILFRPNYVGKLAFIEIPLEHDDDESGEFIIVQQSNDSLYGVDTNSCTAGARVYRIPFSAGDEHITILDAYEDDDFVREFIDRLDDMDTEDYEPWQCDAAETVSRLLSRMLERKADVASSTNTTLLDKMFGRSDLFFGPIGTGKSDCQTEDRCHRVGQGCAV